MCDAIKDTRDLVRAHSIDGLMATSAHSSAGDGSDSRLLFIPGAFQNIENARGFTARLASRASVIVLELPIEQLFSRFPNVAERHTMAGKLIDRVLSDYCWGNCAVLGASYGGLHAINYAVHFGERVKSLILCGVGDQLGENQKSIVRRSIQTLKHRQFNEFAELCVEGLLCRDPSADIPRQAVIRRQLLRSLSQLNTQNRARFIASSREVLNTHLDEKGFYPACPTLVFSGEFDTFTTPKSIKALASRFQNGNFDFVPNADHLCHLEQPGDTAAMILNYAKLHRPHTTHPLT